MFRKWLYGFRNKVARLDVVNTKQEPLKKVEVEKDKLYELRQIINNKSIDSSKRSGNYHAPWSDDEKGELAVLVSGNYSDLEISKLLGRSVKGVQCKRYSLGLRIMKRTKYAGIKTDGDT